MAGWGGGRGRRGVVVCCEGMDGVCGRGKEERREGGREREERRQLTAQNIRTLTSNPMCSGLARHFHRLGKSFEMLPLVQTLSRLL